MKKDIRRDKARCTSEGDEQQHLEPRKTVPLKIASNFSNLVVAMQLWNRTHFDGQQLLAELAGSAYDWISMAGLCTSYLLSSKDLLLEGRYSKLNM